VYITGYFPGSNELIIPSSLIKELYNNFKLLEIIECNL